MAGWTDYNLADGIFDGRQVATARRALYLAAKERGDAVGVSTSSLNRASLTQLKQWNSNFQTVITSLIPYFYDSSGTAYTESSLMTELGESRIAAPQTCDGIWAGQQFRILNKLIKLKTNYDSTNFALIYENIGQIRGSYGSYRSAIDYFNAHSGSFGEPTLYAEDSGLMFAIDKYGYLAAYRKMFRFNFDSSFAQNLPFSSGESVTVQAKLTTYSFRGAASTPYLGLEPLTSTGYIDWKTINWQTSGSLNLEVLPSILGHTINESLIDFNARQYTVFIDNESPGSSNFNHKLKTRIVYYYLPSFDFV